MKGLVTVACIPELEERVPVLLVIVSVPALIAVLAVAFVLGISVVQDTPRTAGATGVSARVEGGGPRSDR